MNNDKIAEGINISGLINKDMQIPLYQRPYTWQPKHVIQLLEDINESMESKQDSYLVGTIIIFKPEDKPFEIVDGQQRLTSLALILHILGYTEFGLLRQVYNHVDSHINIISNYRTIKKWIENKEISESDLKDYILNNVWFVLVTAPSDDEAFVFFDSQNSRGKPLEKYDLLKAHHLRYISDSNEQVAKECTIYWERMDKSKRLGYLIYTLLGRTRAWSRKEYMPPDVLEEFKSQRISDKSDSFYRLNRYQQPPLFEKWRYIDREIHDDDDGLELIFRNIDAWQGTKRLKFVSKSKKFMPFQIMQPLEGGEQFFWFIEKYNQLYNELFDPENHEIPKLFDELHLCLKNIANYNIGMSYILEVFEACCLFYYDKFGPDHLLECACCLEHQLSLLRFEKSTVQYASVRNFVKLNNSIAVINEAAFPEHIIRSLLDNTEGRYRQFENLKIRKGTIRESYFHALYGKEGFYIKNRSYFNDFQLLKRKDKIIFHFDDE
jgi:hypothetical protein